MVKETISDFGPTIKSARKLIWQRKLGITTDDLKRMNTDDKFKYAQKKYIWPTPDYLRMIQEEGMRREVAYFHNVVRKALPPIPKIKNIDSYNFYVLNKKQKGEKTEKTITNDEEVLNFYVQSIRFFKDFAESIQTIDDLKNVKQLLGEHIEKMKSDDSFFMNNPIKVNFFLDVAKINKAFTFCSQRYTWYTSNVEASWFGLTKEEQIARSIHISERFKEEKQYFNVYEIDKKGYIKNTIQRGIVSLDEAEQIRSRTIHKKIVELHNQSKKDKTIPSTTKPIDELKNLARKGDTVIYSGYHATEQDYLKTFGFQSITFGNSTTQQERRLHLDLCYEALVDLCTLLKIDTKNITFDNQLSIAFGALGRGGKKYYAHYEPATIAINLTRKNGFGSLAHEWFHSLDHYLNIFISGKNDGTLLTNNKINLSLNNPISKQMHKLIDVMKYKRMSKEEAQHWLISYANKQRGDISTSFLRALATEDLLNNDISNKEATSRLDLVVHALKEYLDCSIPKDNNAIDTKKKAQLELALFQQVKNVYGEDIKNKYMYIFKKAVTKVQYDIYKYYDVLKQTGELLVKTDFYENARLLDKNSNKLYWASPSEMFARAASAWVAIKAQTLGKQNDYLLKHALAFDYSRDTTVCDAMKYNHPIGKELDAFGKEFESLIEILKEKEILKSINTDYIIGKDLTTELTKSKKTHDCCLNLIQNEQGEFCLDLGFSFSKDKKAMEYFYILSKEKFLEKFPQYSENDYLETKNELDILETSPNKPPVFRYYLTERPIDIGTYPKEYTKEFVRFEEKTSVHGLSEKVYGYIETSEALPSKVKEAYELKEESEIILDNVDFDVKNIKSSPDYLSR